MIVLSQVKFYQFLVFDTSEERTTVTVPWQNRGEHRVVKLVRVVGWKALKAKLSSLFPTQQPSQSHPNHGFLNEPGK